MRDTSNLIFSCSEKGKHSFLGEEIVHHPPALLRIANAALQSPAGRAPSHTRLLDWLPCAVRVE